MYIYTYNNIYNNKYIKIYNIYTVLSPSSVSISPYRGSEWALLNNCHLSSVIASRRQLFFEMFCSLNFISYLCQQETKIRNYDHRGDDTEDC